MNFIISFLISANWKSNSYDLILVIVNWPTTMIHYKPVKVTIDALGQRKMIINMIIRHYKVLESIVID